MEEVCDKCSERGVGFNEDGEFLCEDCLFEDALEEQERHLYDED